MDTAGQELTRLEKRLRQLGTDIDRLAAGTHEAEPGDEATRQRREQVDFTRQKHAVVRSRLDAFKTANGQKWDNFRPGIETAWHDLENALRVLKEARHQ